MNNASCCAVVELRQYTLIPHQRDVLINLFDHEFIESQGAVGISVIGQFRDRGNADRFVWLRGFQDMDGSLTSLAAFYDGPVWAAKRTEASNTMIDSDNVLLLKPAGPEFGFRLAQSAAGTDAAHPSARSVLAGVYEIGLHIDENLVSQFEQSIFEAGVQRCAAAGRS
jgi:hypothetical protein